MTLESYHPSSGAEQGGQIGFSGPEQLIQHCLSLRIHQQGFVHPHQIPHELIFLLDILTPPLEALSTWASHFHSVWVVMVVLQCPSWIIPVLASACPLATDSLDSIEMPDTTHFPF